MLRDVDLQSARGAVALFVGRDKGEIVAAAKVIHQRLKSRIEILGLVREQFAAGFICQRLVTSGGPDA